MKIFVLMLLMILNVNVQANDVCYLLNGSVIIGQDNQNTMLGKITNKFDSDSIFNDYGTFGNPYNSSSIWNQFSTFGNQFSLYSPFNQFSTQPPMIIKNGQVMGYLSSNKTIQNSISPNLLKAMCNN